MEAEFVPYEQALALKELGFNEPCFNYYDGDKSKNSINLGNGYVTKYMVSDNFTIAPLYQQAFRWFREKYNIWNWVERYTESDFYIFQIPSANLKKVQGYYKTYEEAELECLKKLIEIVKEK